MISNILKYLPDFLRSKVENRPGLIKILDNIGWLFFDKILRMGVGLLVGVWVARYLGPKQFGLLNFALAFVGLFGAIATLGLQGIMVRDIVKKPEETDTILGTGFFLRVVGGLVAFVLILVVISYLRPDDALAKTIVAILGFTQVIKASEVVTYWFESQVQSKFVVWVQNSVFLIIAVAKVVMILLHAPLMAFVWAAFAETLFGAALLFAVYGWKIENFLLWRPCFARAKKLLRDSWPLILSGIAVAVYMQIDKIMLGQMVGDQAVGIYSAAVKISEVWYFIPMTIVTSVFPAIIEAKKQSETLYYQRLQRLYNLMVRIAIAVALPMTFLSGLITNFIYGDSYLESGKILSIHIWSGIFVFFGSAWSKWMIIEGYQTTILKLQCLSLISNILLNYMLIPKYQEIGAALSTLISYSCGHTVFAFFFKNQKRAIKMFWKTFIF